MIKQKYNGLGNVMDGENLEIISSNLTPLYKLRGQGSRQIRVLRY